MAIQLKQKAQDWEDIEPATRRGFPWSRVAAYAVISFLVLGGVVFQGLNQQLQQRLDILSPDVCPVGKTVRPASFYKDRTSADDILYDPVFRNKSLVIFQGALRIPTVVQDYMPSPNDEPEAWTEFVKFHAHLEKSFPLVYSNLKVEKVNTHGLLYTWEGSDPELKPLLLMAHQDVVPVLEPTLKDWDYPPFSGHFDGERIWGRGSSDDKTLLIGDLEAVEKLLSEGFKPKRSLILSFGFDEERGGALGARELGKVLKERYGPDSFYAIVDEGVGAVQKFGDRVLTMASIGEKGSLTLEISLNTPGGHSSVPPPHTNIGIISKLISYIEDHPFDKILGAENPTLNYLQCLAKYTDSVDEKLKGSIFRASYDKVANSKVIKYLSQNVASLAWIETTQAVDIINGGVKSNALPEFVSFIINHRISVESSVQATIDKILANVQTIASEYGVGVLYDDKEIMAKTANGFFSLSLEEASLEPAKVSPTDGEEWEAFAGTIKHVVEDYIYSNLTTPSIVAGNLMNGNTDTKHYWGLTDNIYRFTLTTLDPVSGSHIHSVNEHTTLDDHLYTVLFAYEYIKTVNE